MRLSDRPARTGGQSVKADLFGVVRAQGAQRLSHGPKKSPVGLGLYAALGASPQPFPARVCGPVMESGRVYLGGDLGGRGAGQLEARTAGSGAGGKTVHASA